MSDQLKSIVFTAVVALVCALLLTGAASGLKARKLRNVAVDRQKNILKSVGLIKAGASMSAAEIERRYDANIRCYDMASTGRVVPADKAGAGLPVCFYVKANHPKAYIVPVDSSGLWGKIHGYMAIENDGKTVAGFSVYSQNETPGLGGEIEKPWFQKNFVGKKIVDKAGDFVSVGIAKGKVAEVIPKDRQDNYVDGISGASLTGKFLTGGLKLVLRKYEPLAKAFRKGPVSLPAGS